MSISRRSFVTGATTAGLFSGLGAPAYVSSVRADTVLSRNPLIIPALESGRAEADRTIFDLTLKA